MKNYSVYFTLYTIKPSHVNNYIKINHFYTFKILFTLNILIDPLGYYLIIT